MKTVRAAGVVTILCAVLTGAQDSSVRHPTTPCCRFATKEISGWISTTQLLLPAIRRVRSLMDCLAVCGGLSECQSVVWAAKGKTCDVSINASTCKGYASGSDGQYICGQKLEWIYYRMPHFRGCKDARASGVGESAVVHVDPDGSGPINVLCIFTGNESWLIFQRRLDGSQNFSRNWNSYRNGFGDFSTEFWLGLENIRRLSASGVALSIYMEAFDEAKAYANYSDFHIGAENTSYRLHVAGFRGNAGDSLWYHNGSNFSTYDHDPTGYRCANMFTGGWWFNHCVISNLNGLYLNESANVSTANCWTTFKGRLSALRATWMGMNV